MGERDFLSQTDLFASGEEGYHTYRIPALTTTGKGTVLAFCEGRKDSRSHAELELKSRPRIRLLSMEFCFFCLVTCAPVRPSV